MKKNEIEKLLNNGLKKFIEKEKFLLENDINERTISAKLAEYLQKEFSDYNIDCEYNRMLDSDERKFITKKLDLDIEEIESYDKKGTTVFPDIIIHKRTYNIDNLVIIEIKKKKYADKKNESGETYRNFDLKKINAYMEQLNYKYGVYIEFDGIKISQTIF